MPKDENGKKIKDAVVKVLKSTLKIFTKKWAVIGITLALIIIMLGGAYDALMDAFSDKVSNFTSENPIQYDTVDNSIVISDEQVDELIKQLERMGFSLDSLHLTKDLIKKCYAAEVVSQELNRGVQEQEGKYYGRIYVRKASNTNTSTAEAVPLTYVSYEEMTGGKTESGTTTSSFDNFLFIGDSRTEGMRANLEALGNNVKVYGAVSSSPNQWMSVIQNGSGSINGTNITLPESVTGVSIALGVNGTGQVESMKAVLNNLLSRYPNKPIYVNSVFYVGAGYNIIPAEQMNANIDGYNKSIKEFCETNVNLIYVDISNGLYESNYLKSTYTSDNLHLNTSGNIQLAQNIKDSILNTSGEPTVSKQLSSGKDITECFSVSPDGKLVTASKTVNTDNNGNATTNIRLQELEYKSKVSKYITPFEFLINLCVATQNPEYVSTLADKIVKETSIVITIMDNVTTIDTTRTYKYKSATSVDQEGRIYTKNNETGEYSDSGRRNPRRGNPTVTLPSESTEYSIGSSTNNKIEAHNPTIQITSVDTWFVKQEITYNNKTDGPTEDTAYEEIEAEIPSHTDASYKYQYTTEDTINTAEEIRMYISTVTYKVNQMTEIITNTTINTYSEGVSESDSGSVAEGKTDEILQMLKDRYKIPNSTLKEAPIYKLENGAEIFFKMLQKSSRTQELERIMRYVLYLYNGKDYGVTELDWNQYCIPKLNNVVFGTDIGKEFTKSWENDALRKYMNGETSYSGKYVVNYITEDNTKFVCYTDVRNTRNYGFGICHYTGGAAGGTSNNHIDKYAALGIDIKAPEYNILNESLMDVDIVMTIFDQVYEEMKQEALNNREKFAPGSPELTEGQLICLTDMRYQGSIKWKDFYTIYATQNEEKIKEYILGRSEQGRGQARWKAYSQEIYMTRGGEILDKNMYVGTSDVVKFALSLVGENHTRFTSYSPTENNITFYGNFITCEGNWCAMFVSYCYHQCGLIPDILPRPFRGCEEYKLMKEQTTRWRYRGSYIPQPGDIIFFTKNGTESYHTGLVKETDGAKVYTIEGNTGYSSTNPYWRGSHVEEKDYTLNSSKILGYFSINNS